MSGLPRTGKNLQGGGEALWGSCCRDAMLSLPGAPWLLGVRYPQGPGHPGVMGKWHPFLVPGALGAAPVLTQGAGAEGDGTVGKWAAVGAKWVQAGCRGQGASARPALPGVGLTVPGTGSTC